MKTHSAVSEAIVSLRAFVKALKKRPDVQVDVATFGRKAPKTLLKGAESRLSGVLDGELLAFYAAVNGVEIRWHFLEVSLGGHLVIPPLSDSTAFEREDQHHMGFGDDKEALFLDGTGDGGTWIVRPVGSDEPGEIVFAMAAEGDAGFALGGSLAGYLTTAMASGAVVNWPACSGREGGSFSASEASVRKFKAAPVRPQAVRTGVRVQVRAFKTRGTVLETLEIGSSVLSSYQSHLGTRFAKVELDVGFTAWLPIKYMKVHKKADPYQNLRGKLEQEDLSGLLEDIACAVGPAGYSSSVGRQNAPRGAALLAPYSLHQAFERTFDVHDAVLASGLDLKELLDLEPRKAELFLKADFAKRDWQYSRQDSVIALIGGLNLLLRHAGGTRREHLTEEMVARLEQYEPGPSQGINAEIRRISQHLDDTLRPVDWATHNDNIAKKIGLDDGELLLVGS